MPPEDFAAQLAAVRATRKRSYHRATPAPEPAQLDRARSTNPYMLGRRAFVAGLPPTPPGELSREAVEEFRRGWHDARTWHLIRNTVTR